jgi:2-polyprenyl-3-methyl-5-hydroxy-6-metoxy-1,4-benzoquinol methylase
MPDGCAICGGVVFVDYLRISSRIASVPLGLDRGLQAEAEIERCVICGLLRTRGPAHWNPDSLYTDQSISLAASHAKTTELGKRAVYSIDELTFLGSQRGRLLDVGCSSGYFLSRARDAGWDVEGTELDPKAAAIARQAFNLPVHSGDIRDLSFADSQFDAITLWGVLEHLTAPQVYLRHLSRLLKPQGVIVVGVPNSGSLNALVSQLSRHSWDMFLEPGHLHHFTLATLSRLGRSAGLVVANWSTMTCAIRGKLPFLPWRFPSIERRIDRWDSRSPLFSGMYRGMLTLIDWCHAGDILVVAFRKDAQHA